MLFRLRCRGSSLLSIQVDSVLGTASVRLLHSCSHTVKKVRPTLVQNIALQSHLYWQCTRQSIVMERLPLHCRAFLHPNSRAVAYGLLPVVHPRQSIYKGSTVCCVCMEPAMMRWISAPHCSNSKGICLPDLPQASGYYFSDC